MKTEKESEDDNRDNNSVTPTLCHGKEDDATKILHYQNCRKLYKINQNLLGTAEKSFERSEIRIERIKPIQIKKGNYIHVDTTTKNNKNYLNQQHKQLCSTTLRGNQLPAALKII